MINSIHHFCLEGVKNLEKVMVDYSSDMTRIAEMVQGVQKSVLELGRSVIAEELEGYDEILRERRQLRPDWQIVKRDETTLLTILGSITYRKTLFKNKITGQREYLLDRVMGLEKHARMTEDAEAALLKEAVQTSYRKGGEHAAITQETVSKETVMNKIHALRFPEAEPGEKKQVKYLYVDADEDHVSLQYLEKKGDITKPRTNTVMPKLVYVYEGISNENGRNELLHKRYFGGVCEAEELWKEVRRYMESAYDMETLEKIYINGDGAAWIKRGVQVLDKAVFILDRFHMNKYITAATSHLSDSAEDARRELYRAINGKKKRRMERIFEQIRERTDSDTKRRSVEQAERYLLGNWDGIMERIRDQNKEVKCSAEGHISHVFADRMSSRPLGWSRKGADKMARLRVYEKNGGDMLELVRYQKKELPKAAGCEEVICSCEQVLASERANRRKLGALADMPVYSIPYPQIKKIANFKDHIYGL